MKQCYQCGGNFSAVSELREVSVGRRSAMVMDEFIRCDSCGEEAYLPGQMDASMRHASDAIRQEEGLLTAREIHAIRDRLGLSQADFEKLLGVGPKTVVRWEKGTVFQNSATDSLLRVLRDVEGVAERLATLHAVTLPVWHLSWKPAQVAVRREISVEEGWRKAKGADEVPGMTSGFPTASNWLKVS